MQKRRVGVTAESRLIVENQATGTPQIASEIAAPLLYPEHQWAPVATATIRVRMEAWRYYGRRQGNRAESSSKTKRMGIRESRWENMASRTDALKARMRRCLILRQGASPLRPIGVKIRIAISGTPG